MESLERRTPPVARESRELRVPRFELAKPLLDHQLQQPLDYKGLVILEVQVDVQGVVKSVNVLRGHPLFDEPAMEAVRQWRYQPLLLNGVPTGFILTVTVLFNMASAGA